MNLREAFDTFGLALERARASDANLPEAVVRDLPDLEQARLLLAMYFDDGTRRALKHSLREEALRRLDAVHEREPPTREHTVYHVMYGLFAAFAKEPLTQAGDVPAEAGDRSREDDLARQCAALRTKIDELERELDRERQSRQELTAVIAALAPAIENVRRPLVQIGDIFSNNSNIKLSALSGNRVTISMEDFFGLGKPGVELVKALVEGVRVLGEGIRKIALSDQTRNLFKDIVAGARRLVRNIARHVRDNPDLDHTAEGLDEVPNDNRAIDPRSLEPLDVFRDRLKDGTAGPEMIVIPAGSFMMGSPESDKEANENEKPQRRVTISRAFALARTPVTFEEYRRFCTATGRALPDGAEDLSGQMPVVNVSWYDAHAYCEWLAKETGAGYRLPSESEWEYACRAGTRTRYWWGDEWDTKRANNGNRLTEVGVYPENPWRLLGLLGNAWEWCADHYEKDIRRLSSDARAYIVEGRSQNLSRVARGGSWDVDPRFLRCAFRDGWNGADSRSYYLGFRLARTL